MPLYSAGRGPLPTMRRQMSQSMQHTSHLEHVMQRFESEKCEGELWMRVDIVRYEDSKLGAAAAARMRQHSVKQEARIQKQYHSDIPVASNTTVSATSDHSRFFGSNANDQEAHHNGLSNHNYRHDSTVTDTILDWDLCYCRLEKATLRVYSVALEKDGTRSQVAKVKLSGIRSFLAQLDSEICSSAQPDTHDIGTSHLRRVATYKPGIRTGSSTLSRNKSYDSTARKHGFAIRTSSNKRYMFASSDTDQIRDWRFSLQKALLSVYEKTIKSRERLSRVHKAAAINATMEASSKQAHFREDGNEFVVPGASSLKPPSGLSQGLGSGTNGARSGLSCSVYPGPSRLARVAQRFSPHSTANRTVQQDHTQNNMRDIHGSTSLSNNGSHLSCSLYAPETGSPFHHQFSTHFNENRDVSKHPTSTVHDADVLGRHSPAGDITADDTIAANDMFSMSPTPLQTSSTMNQTELVRTRGVSVGSHDSSGRYSAGASPPTGAGYMSGSSTDSSPTQSAVVIRGRTARQRAAREKAKQNQSMNNDLNDVCGQSIQSLGQDSMLSHHGELGSLLEAHAQLDAIASDESSVDSTSSSNGVLIRDEESSSDEDIAQRHTQRNTKPSVPTSNESIVSSIARFEISHSSHVVHLPSSGPVVASVTKMSIASDKENALDGPNQFDTTKSTSRQDNALPLRKPGAWVPPSVRRRLEAERMRQKNGLPTEECPCPPIEANTCPPQDPHGMDCLRIRTIMGVLGQDEILSSSSPLSNSSTEDSVTSGGFHISTTEKEARGIRKMREKVENLLAKGDTEIGQYSAVFGCQGVRPSMQDKHVLGEFMCPELRTCIEINTNTRWQSDSPSKGAHVAFFAVYDGHGGELAAEFAAKRLHLYALEHGKFCKAPIEAVETAFARVDDEFREAATLESTDGEISRQYMSGSTAVVTLLRPSTNSLFVWSLGDSRAVLKRQDSFVELSTTHSPESECQRIEAAGGWVTRAKEMNIKDAQHIDVADPDVRLLAEKQPEWQTVSRVNGELGVSRALGDLVYKAPLMNQSEFLWPPGYQRPPPEEDVFKSNLVLATPDVCEVELEHGDEFMLLACDGLFDVLTPGDVVRLADGLLERDAPVNVCRRLVEIALKLGSEDNITCMIVVLPTAKRHAKHYKGPAL